MKWLLKMYHHTDKNNIPISIFNAISRKQLTRLQYICHLIYSSANVCFLNNLDHSTGRERQSIQLGTYCENDMIVSFRHVYSRAHIKSSTAIPTLYRIWLLFLLQSLGTGLRNIRHITCRQTRGRHSTQRLVTRDSLAIGEYINPASGQRRQYQDSEKMFVLKMFASLLGLYAVLTTAVSPAPVHLCPYGVGLDNVATVNDDRSVGPISIPAFKYYNKINHRLYVSTLYASTCK